MLTVRVGKLQMPRHRSLRGCIRPCLWIVVPLVLIMTLIWQRYNSSDDDSGRHSFVAEKVNLMPITKNQAGPCAMEKNSCSSDDFSFYMQSGAANVVAPKICIQNKLVLGQVIDNSGYGINIVLMNGKTGEVTKTDHFDMYSGDVAPLISLLKSIEKGTVVLVASYDEPSSKLNEEARKLFADLGSSAIQSLGFRDNWVFVGAKGAKDTSSFEKVKKNDREKNKYENWPEIVDIQGCIPKYLD